jgi:hypothetical protein
MPGGALAVRQTDNIPEYRGKIDLAEAFKLKFKNNYTYRMLADRYGVVPAAVHGALKQFLNLMHSPEQSAVYEEKRAEILNAVEFRIVKQMVNKKKLKAASLNNLAYAASQINNMIRLEKGQPTSITESLDADLSGLLDRIAPLKSAGSGSTIHDVSSVNVDIDVDNAVNQAIGLPAPPADRSTSANLEASIPAVQPTKPAKRTKSASKSATKNRKQNASNITASLNSKVDDNKEGSEPVPNSTNTSSATKEWYE